MSRNDPQSPDYSPTYRGQDGRNVGSGTEFGADLEKLYGAGQLVIPATANKYADAAESLHWVIAQLDTIAGELGHYGLWAVKSRASTVYDAMALSAKRLHDAADVLVEIADDYAGTDQAARDEFDALLNDSGGAYDNPPPRHDPPAPDDPPTTPENLPPDDDLEDTLDDILEDADIEDQMEDEEDEEDEG